MIDGDEETVELVRAALAERADGVRFAAPVQILEMRPSPTRWIAPALVAALLLAFVGLSVMWLRDDESGSGVVATQPDTGAADDGSSGVDDDPDSMDPDLDSEERPGGDASQDLDPALEGPLVELPETAPTIAVWGVERTDVLNVRSGAGTGNEIILRLDHDAAGLVHTGAVETVGSDTWWEIVAADGTTGWVNRRYLTVGETDLSELEESLLIERSIQAFNALGPSPTVAFEAYADSFSVGGIGIFADASQPFQPVDHNALDTPREWDLGFPVEPGECPECRVSVRTFLGIGERELSEAYFTVGPGDDYSPDGWGVSTGLPPEFYERFVVVTAYTPTSDLDTVLDWSRYTFVFDFQDGEPLLAGVFRYGWTP